MANSTDPFGKQVFGGQTSISGQIPGGTSMTAPTAAKPAYQYAGHAWDDPLAQQMYTKYAFGGRGSTQVPNLVDMAHRQQAAGMQNMNYNTPIDPTTWGGTYQGDDVNKMKEAYIAAGGQGTYEQQTGTYKTPAETATAQALVKSGGSGSMNTLSPDILQKMWR